jgi:hypothetical protein
MLDHSSGQASQTSAGSSKHSQSAQQLRAELAPSVFSSRDASSRLLPRLPATESIEAAPLQHAQRKDQDKRPGKRFKVLVGDGGRDCGSRAHVAAMTPKT